MKCRTLRSFVFAAVAIAAVETVRGGGVEVSETELTLSALVEQNTKLRGEAEALREEVKSLTVTLAQTVAELDIARAQAGKSKAAVTAAGGSIGDVALAVVDANRPLNMVVLSAGEGAGVKPGMKFAVLRDQRLVARVRASDVRETIAGAVVEELETNNFPEKGDRVIIWREKSAGASER